jgi:Ca2+-binding RTX toxin-like protein
MEYDQRSNTLLAGTLGRGAWTISNVKSTIGLESRLQIDGTTNADTVNILRNANNPLLLDVFLNVPVNILDPRSFIPTLEVQLSVVQTIHVATGNGADQLQIVSTGGIVSVPHGIVFVAGFDKGAPIQPVDTLVLNNASDTRGETGRMLADGIDSMLVGPLTFSGVESITIKFGSGSDTFNGAATNVPLTLIGGRGSDNLIGGSNSDHFNGVDGISGNDHFFGGPGNDTAQLDPGDTFDGETGQDGIDFFGTSGNDHILVKRQVGPDGPQALIEMNNKTQVFNYVNGETINVYAGAGNDHVEMDASAGTHWKAQFFGQEGNDRLIGGAMDDLLDGGPGNDFLDGAGGDNVLIGGGGHDVLRNGHAPLAAPTIAAAATAIFTGSTKTSIAARLIQAPVQLDNGSRQLKLSRIDSNNRLLAGYLQSSRTKDLASSGAILLERNGRSHVLDDALLNALASGALSKDDGSVTGTFDRAFETALL